MLVILQAVLREAVELDILLASNSQEVEVLFGLFHKGMVHVLNANRRKEPLAVRSLWNEAIWASLSSVISLFIRLHMLHYHPKTHPLRPNVSSVALVEKKETNRSLCSIVPSKRIARIRLYVNNEIKGIGSPQRGLLHPQRVRCRRVLRTLPLEIRTM